MISIASTFIHPGGSHQPRLAADEFDEQRKQDFGVCRQFSQDYSSTKKNGTCTAKRERKSRALNEEWGDGVLQ